MMKNLKEFLLYFAFFIIIFINKSQYATGCADNESNLELCFGKVNCKKGSEESTGVGIIISDRFILTASTLPSDIWCEIVYKESAEATGSRDSVVITNFEIDINLYPWLTPQLQILQLVEPITYKVKEAAPIDMTTKPLKKFKDLSTCELHTVNADNKVREYVATIVPRKECEAVYDPLHEDIICVKMPDGCDHCKLLKGGSGLACEDKLVGVSPYLLSTVHSHDLLSTIQSHYLWSTVQSHDLLSTIQSHDLLSTLQSHYLWSTLQSPYLLSTVQSHDLLSTIQTHYLWSTVQSHDLLSTIQSPYFLSTVQSH
uniref:Peptidase S1 domain-containing protein n=1 Tax=Glossina brevipalpis TaxID=37001 RepID=A0A1A9WL07_9MUSC